MYGRATHDHDAGVPDGPRVTKQKLKPGTVRRIAGYAKPYRL